jgi:hypothetical protein
MRALTLTQPWAGLVASGIKLVENRARKIAPRDLFGQRFAIHASRQIDEDVYDRIKVADPSLFTQNGYRRWYWLSRITSAAIAVATLDRMIVTGPNSELNANDYEVLEAADQVRWCFGPVVYVLRDVRALVPDEGASERGRAARQASIDSSPKVPSYDLNRAGTANPERGIPCRGYQGFWTLPGDVERAVRAQIVERAA